MKILIVALTFTLLTLTCQSAAGQQVEWKRYSVQSAGFSIELPTVPSMTLVHRHDERTGKQLEERIIGAYADGVAYSIQAFENPFSKAGLDELIRKFAQRYGAGGDSMKSKDLL